MYLIAFVVLLITILAWFILPLYRHYRKSNEEREQLEKRYNRLWRSRRDLLVSRFVTILQSSFFVCLTSSSIMSFFNRVTWTGPFLGRTRYVRQNSQGKKSRGWTERWKSCIETFKHSIAAGSISNHSCPCRALRRLVED